MMVNGKQPLDLTGDVLGNLIPSSTLQCVNVQTIIEENAALIAGEVDLKWAFYKDPSNNVLWEVYRQKFTEPMSHPLDVKFEGGEITMFQRIALTCGQIQRPQPRVKSKTQESI